MISLGINEGINSSVVIAENGKINFAVQEERINHVKNFLGFPRQSITFAMDYLKLDPGDVDFICFSNEESPLGTLESFLASYDRSADSVPSNFGVISSQLFHLLPDDLRMVIRNKVTARKTAEKYQDLARLYEEYLREYGFSNAKIIRRHHHFNHAAAAYYGLREKSEEPYLVLTLDGGGDHSCSHVYIGEAGRLKLLASTPQGNSIGNIYSHVTHFLGMRPHDHEYKIMGLAAYSKPEYTKEAYRIFESYIGLDSGNPLVFKSNIPERTYLIEHRFRDDLKRIRFDNIAGGLQRFTEDLILKWIESAVKITGIHKILVSGGVFMNVKANARISSLETVERFDIFPSCGDESLPFGAVWSQYAENSPGNGDDIQFRSYCLGPDPGYDFVQAKQKFGKTLYFYDLPNPEKTTAQLLADGKIVARCSGNMEFGARALGNRSILADPQNYGVIPEINKMIKQRDFWMPFAPAILREGAENYIHIPKSLPENKISPYMMTAFDTTDRRKEFIAGIHNYDLTARAQIVTAGIQPEFHSLIEKFSEYTGKTVVLNTSYNLHGYPIVMGSHDAIEVMLASSLEYLVINDHLITKTSVLNPERYSIGSPAA